VRVFVLNAAEALRFRLRAPLRRPATHSVRFLLFFAWFFSPPPRGRRRASPHFRARGRFPFPLAPEGPRHALLRFLPRPPPSAAPRPSVCGPTHHALSDLLRSPGPTAMAGEDGGEAKKNKKKGGTVSKVLGYCIIVGAAGAKTPQILQILRAGNAAGLSLLMPVMEVLGCTPLPDATPLRRQPRAPRQPPPPVPHPPSRPSRPSLAC